MPCHSEAVVEDHWAAGASLLESHWLRTAKPSEGQSEGLSQNGYGLLAGHKTTPTPEMTQQSSSCRFGVDFDRKPIAHGPKTGTKLPGPAAGAVWDRFLVRPQ